jgi:hypothetical protein
VLDRDPYETDDVANVNVVATMLGGRWTYNAPPWEDR